MEIKQIVVDELPLCPLCKNKPAKNSELSNRIMVYCENTNCFLYGLSFHLEEWVQKLPVENECVWVHKFYDTYKPDCKDSIVSQNTYIYCPNCGKKIKRIKCEEKE